MALRVDKFPILEPPAPMSINDFTFPGVGEDSNSGYGYSSALNTRMHEYHGYKTFLDNAIKDVPPDTQYVFALYDPDTVKTPDDIRLIRARSQEYGRAYGYMMDLFQQYFLTESLRPVADFRREKLAESNSMWVLSLERRNPIMAIAISFDATEYSGITRDNPKFWPKVVEELSGKGEAKTKANSNGVIDGAGSLWPQTFTRELRQCKINALPEQFLKSLKNDGTSGISRYQLILPPENIDLSRLYFIVEFYFVNNDNINAPDKEFLTTNTANLGNDILEGRVSIPESKKRSSEAIAPPVEGDTAPLNTPAVPMEVDVPEGPPKYSEFLPLDEAPVATARKKVKRGKKEAGELVKSNVSELQTQITSTYYNIFTQFITMTALNLKVDTKEDCETHPLEDLAGRSSVDYGDSRVLSDSGMRTNNPNFAKKIEHLQGIIDTCMYYRVADLVSHDLIDAEIAAMKNNRTEKDLALLKGTINGVVQAAFTQALAGKNIKKQETAIETPNAWTNFVDTHLLKPTSIFKPAQLFAKTMETIFMVSNNIIDATRMQEGPTILPVFEWRSVTQQELNNLDPPRCILTCTPIVFSNYEKAVRLYFTFDSPYKIYLRDANLIELFTINARSLCIWKDEVLALIQTHVFHHFKLYRRKFNMQMCANTEGDFLDDASLELCIIHFFTEYIRIDSERETHQIFQQSVKLNKPQQDLRSLLAGVEEAKEFGSIEDLINLVMAVLLDAMKTLAFYKNIFMELQKKNAQ